MDRNTHLPERRYDDRFEDSNRAGRNVRSRGGSRGGQDWDNSNYGRRRPMKDNWDGEVDDGGSNKWDSNWRGGPTRKGGLGSSRDPQLTGANSVRIDRDYGDYNNRGSFGGRPDWSSSASSSHLDNRGMRRRNTSQIPGRTRSRSKERLLPPQALQRYSRERSPKDIQSKSSDHEVMKSREMSDERRSCSSTASNEGKQQRRSTSLVKEDEYKKEEEGIAAELNTNNENEEEGEVKEDELKSVKESETHVAEEVYSDFGESDDELLSKEMPPVEEEDINNAVEEGEDVGGEEEEEMEDKKEEGEAVSRSSSRRSNREEGTLEHRQKPDNDLLEGISDEDLAVSDEEEDAKKTKAKMADALGVSFFAKFKRNFLVTQLQVDWRSVSFSKFTKYFFKRSFSLY